MVGVSPAPLTTLAADAYFNVFYNSKTCVFFMENGTGSVSFTELEGSLEYMFTKHMDSLKCQLTSQLNYFRTLKNLDIIKKYFKLRSNRLFHKRGEILLSFYISDTVVINFKDRVALHCLAYLGIKNCDTVTLRSADIICKDTLRACSIIFPRLQYMHVRVEMVSREILDCLEILMSYLKVICIVSQRVNVVNEDLCHIFFSKTHNELRNCYRNCIEIPKKYSKLEYLHLPICQINRYSFLKYFLHYYPNVDFMSLNLNPYDIDDLSVFDGVLCYTIDLNPYHALHVCDLLYVDLRFPYLEDCLLKWVNLKKLSILIRSFKVPLDHKKCSKTLSSILKRNKNITHFTVSIDSEDCVKYFHYIQDAVENSGDNIREVRLIPGKMRVSDVIKFVNCFPSVVCLYIDVYMQSSNPKNEGKFKHLSKLDTLYLKCLGSPCVDGLRMFKGLLGSAKNLKHFNFECIGAFIMKLDGGFLPPSVETFSLVMVYANKAIVKCLCSQLLAANLKEFRFGIHNDYPDYYIDPTANAETRFYDLIVTPFKNSFLTFRCEDTLTIHHVRLDDTKLLKNLKYLH